MSNFQNEARSSPPQTIAKVSYTHDAMIDMIVADPTVHQNDLARYFGFSPSWVSTVKNSDAFQARLAERRGELIDPVVVASIDERFRALADASLDLLLERVTHPALKPTDDFLIQTAKLSAGALGYGAKAPVGNTVNLAVVVQVPPKIASSSEWAAAHAPLVQRVTP